MEEKVNVKVKFTPIQATKAQREAEVYIYIYILSNLGAG
jgi:hypothetical protein